MSSQFDLLKFVGVWIFCCGALRPSENRFFGWFFHFPNSRRTRNRMVLARTVGPFAVFCDWLLFGTLQLASLVFLNLFFANLVGQNIFANLAMPIPPSWLAGLPGDEDESGPNQAGRSGSVAATSPCSPANVPCGSGPCRGRGGVRAVPFGHPVFGLPGLASGALRGSMGPRPPRAPGPGAAVLTLHCAVPLVRNLNWKASSPIRSQGVQNSI